MVTKRYRCLNCGLEFEAQVFEKGEAEAKQMQSGPVHCPRCKRTDVEPES